MIISQAGSGGGDDYDDGADAMRTNRSFVCSSSGCEAAAHFLCDVVSVVVVVFVASAGQSWAKVGARLGDWIRTKTTNRRLWTIANSYTFQPSTLADAVLVSRALPLASDQAIIGPDCVSEFSFR